MPLAEIVTIEVGAAVAKSILKLWLKDSIIAEDVSSSLIDLLKSRTSDVLAQRRGQRQFEAIGEKVGENLLSLFKSEGAHLDDGSRTSVALAVAEAFNKSKLSSELLAEHNLEPTKLAKLVLAAHPRATELFSEAETAFYQRIIEESCAYIVDIASQLPAFTERTFAEILKRENQLVEKAEQNLQEVRRIRKWLGPTEEGRFEEDYCKAVARSLDMLQLFGTDVSTASRRHRLSVAYITLSVEQKFSSLPENQNRSDALVTKMPNGSQNGVDKNSVSVDVALARSKRLLIRGVAGSGKTTLLQWIAVRSATKSFEEKLSGWNATIPFYIRLRHCVQSGLPRPEAFPGLVAPAIAATMPPQWVHEQLESGRALVLVDGLDEVSVSHREEVGVWLKELVTFYPKAQFIVTSRPHAIEEGWMDSEGFSDAQLQPMQLSDIYSFIDHWHKAVQEELHEYVEQMELVHLAEHLKGDVKRNRSIRNLATNPLLCAMLCALNRDRRQQLPADRIELYEACCSLLLERRDKESRVELTDYPALNYRQKLLLLQDLAYWMIRNERSEVALQYVEERLDRKLKDMPGVAQDISGFGVRRLFVERASIIREPVTGQIDFTHRTFQEFLAAKAATDEMDTGILKANANNDQWREVIILASGLATKQMREELIRGLITRGDAEQDYRSQLHLLAVSCLETSIELGQEVKTEVENRLSQLVPPKNMIDAQALAAAGELALGHLTKGEYSDTIIAACIRTLALIGGDAALELLEGYADDTRPEVIDELIRSWDNFDRETYARYILTRTLKNVSDLHLKRIPSLEGIHYFPQLMSLTLSDCDQLRDLSPLVGLPQLVSLTVSRCSHLSDINLKGLAQLTSLNVIDCSQLSHVSLRDLNQLALLNLSHCSQLNTVGLAGLVQLTSLDLSGCSQLKNLSPLVDLAQLISLNLSGCSQLRSIALSGLTQLTSLDLSYCSELSTLSLKGLTQLALLNLSHCSRLSDLTSLLGLTQLTSLDLSYCAELSNLNSLKSFVQLKFLDLSYCPQLSSLNPLRGLIELISLNLSHSSQLRDLSPLADLAHLSSLNLSFCTQFHDLSPLKSLEHLRSLDLSGCSQLKDLNTLVALTKLEELKLYGIRTGVSIPQNLRRKVKG